MIVPVFSEAAWLRALDGTPQLVPAMRRALIIAPHPDDETLSAGGLIAALCSRGVEVTVAAVTDGEKAYPNEPELAQVRRREQIEALAVLGVPSGQIYHFELPDSDVSSCEEKLSELLQPLVTADTHILAPWRGDFHPDHEACGRTAERVAAHTGAQLLSYFFWTWHRGTPATFENCDLVAYPLTHELLTIKSQALSCHRSQLKHDSGQPILPENLLAPAQRPFEVFARV